jgi:hypothetical protein
MAVQADINPDPVSKAMMQDVAIDANLFGGPMKFESIMDIHESDYKIPSVNLITGNMFMPEAK